MLASDADIRSYKWLQDVLANVISKPFVNVISKPFVNIPSARARPVLLMYLWRVMNVHVMYINVYMVKENLFKKKCSLWKFHATNIATSAHVSHEFQNRSSDLSFHMFLSINALLHVGPFWVPFPAKRRFPVVGDNSCIQDQDRPCGSKSVLRHPTSRIVGNIVCNILEKNMLYTLYIYI